jgi:tRNA-Thr(GGU) m(6)t(6)A37 methyltransferase TsaA
MMIELLTPQVKLIALNKRQLFELAYETELLEKSLSFSISPALINDHLKQLVGKKLEKIKKSDLSDLGWMTYWVVQPLENQIGAGLLEFKGLPNASGGVEIGFGIDPSYQHQEWVSEAVEKLCEWALEQPECEFVSATSVVDPLALQVFEKAGFIKMAQVSTESLWHCYPDLTQIPHLITGHGFQSIGTIHTGFVSAIGTPIQPNAAKDSMGSIILHPALTEGLKDLDGFSHIILLYVFDRTSKPNLIVKPFMDDQERGVFATRAPARPNPIGLSIVRLVNIEGNRITFTGADMLNNTPLLDIKPYAPQFDPTDEVRIGWLEDRIERLKDSKDDGRFL